MPCGSRISASIVVERRRRSCRAPRDRAAPSPCRAGAARRARPAPVGSVDTRTSTCLSPSFSAMRPSCGRRFSAMSRLAMILRRDTSAACSARGGSMTSRSTPSTRKRTTERASYGSKCRSDARSRSACSSSALIMRITGACAPLSSRSSACGRSCSRRARSPSRDEVVAQTLRGAAPGCRRARARRRSARRRPTRVASGRCSTRFSSAMPSTVASGRSQHDDRRRLRRPCASTPCVRANAYGMRCA